MIRTKLLSWLSIFVYSCTFFLASFTMWVPPAEAFCLLGVVGNCQKAKSSLVNKGGVKRGPCAGGDDESLIALAPARRSETSEERYPTTVESYPTFWFYLPAYKSSVKLAKFVLLDQDNHIVTKDQKPIDVKLPTSDADNNNSKTSGVIAGLTLPSTEKALEVGKKYTWHFSIICDRQKPSRNPEVIGQIQRVIQEPPPRITVPDYVVHDNTSNYPNKDTNSLVWYDTVNQLVKKRKTYPSDWKDLLSKSEIPDSVQNQPIVELRLYDFPADKQNESCA